MIEGCGVRLGEGALAVAVGERPQEQLAVVADDGGGEDVVLPAEGG